MNAILSSLKLVNAKRQNVVDPIQFRRNKLNQKLMIQIEMAKAFSRGEKFTQKRTKKFTDTASGQTSIVEVQKPVRQWWFVNNDTKKVTVQLFYGNKVVDFAKGKNAVEVANGTELISVLGSLRSAVEGGELDAQITAASDVVKARFKR